MPSIIQQKARAAIAALALLLPSPFSQAAGPSNVATGGNYPWPSPLNHSGEFDKASRAALLIYGYQINALETQTDAEILKNYKIKSVNRTGVDNWIKAEKTRIFNNYQIAASSCVTTDWTCIALAANASAWFVQLKKQAINPPVSYQPWSQNLHTFAFDYIGEQIRLAALFPKVTSEIATFSTNEWTGNNLPDKHFYLTFDDGPALDAKANSPTTTTLAMLKAEGKSATFFVLGKSLEQKIKTLNKEQLNQLYSNHCIASHGWEHKSHSQWPEWQESVTKTEALLSQLITPRNKLALFRPPYGQRLKESDAFFRRLNLQVALWNIDSQDWNNKLNAADITHRILLLMLIKRHGVLLFHDIHPKAAAALPVLFKELGGSVNWGDCHKL